MAGARSNWSWTRIAGLCLAIFAWLAVAGTAQASSRDLKWKTLETEHFYIHYYASEEEAAVRAAMHLERAYERLTQAYSHEVFLKTHVTMVDNTDSANGSATAAPFPRINGYVTAPDSMSVLESYDDWINILMTHEFVHVVHLDTVHGLPRLVNALLGFGVLGKVWTPNIVQPRWIVEGLATYEESHLTAQGRRRSAQFDNMLRMHVLEQGFLSIDRVSSGANLFPHGTVVYLYGLHLIHYIASRYGRDKLRELSHVFGGQTIPYGINRALKKVIGIDFYQLWEEFELDTTRRFQDQARRIRARGIREGRRLTFSVANSASGQFTRHPFWSQDDRYVYFYEDDGNSNPGIRRIDSRGGRMREGVGVGREGMNVDVERVIDVQQSASGSFVGASQDMVFELLRTHDFRYSWNDLYRWHAPNPNHVERLTYGLRTRDPHVSPDGHTVVFSRNDSAQSRLAFLDLDSLEVVEIPPMGRISQVFSPRWAPDGERVAFSGWREGGFRDIYIYNRRDGSLQAITADRFVDIEPSWTPDGRYVLFSSDRDQVMNVYAYDVAAAKTWQVTNVLGGAYEPVPSHDGERLAYIGASSTGYDLWVMDLDPAAFFEPLPVIEPLPQVDDPTPALEMAEGRHLGLKSERYKAIKTMYPRTLLPANISYASTGIGPFLGGNVGVTDVAGIHTLAADAGYFFDYNEPTGGVSYRYRQLVPSFAVGFDRGFALRNGFNRFNYDHAAGDDGAYLETTYRERITRGSAAIGVPVLRHPIHSADASLAYAFTRYTNLDRDAEPIDPNAPASTYPLVGDVGQLELEFSYNNIRSVRHGYGDQTGRRASMRVVLIDPHLGGDYGDVQVTAAYTEYVKMPWRGRHVLAMRLGAGASAGGFGRRGAFFLGGFGQQGDLLRSLIALSSNFELGALQGYAPSAVSGQYFGILNLSYRVPLVDVERGLGTVPLFFRRLVFQPFSDIGGAWSGALTKDAIKIGAGASMIFSFKIGYLQAINLFLTYAHGFDKELGVDTFRAALGRSF
ncbi:MAG: PD40 domain-containing protein [Myxococcales bacterium]|nr:PD40 domain-containing protein [Myxococcales bacterium]